jgi:orotate phosphoribosyltransferase
MVAIFTYGFQIAEENFKKENIDLHTLSDYQHLANLASETGYIREEQLRTLMEWRENPSTWKP